MLKMFDGDPRPQRPRGPKPVRIDPSDLLDAAQRVFAQSGVDGGSIRAIAKEAKCDPSLLYYHFANKEAIFEAILERKFSRFIPDLESVASEYQAKRLDAAQGAPDPGHGRTALQEALWQTLKLFHKHIKDDAAFRGMIRGTIAANQGFAKGEMLKHVSRVMQTVRKYLSWGVESGEMRGDINIDTAAFFFIRTSVDILDFFPMLSPGLMSVPVDEAIDVAEEQWFQLFWAGVAKH
jgi:AcrR family transcriptional regulator